MHDDRDERRAEIRAAHARLQELHARGMTVHACFLEAAAQGDRAAMQAAASAHASINAEILLFLNVWRMRSERPAR